MTSQAIYAIVIEILLRALRKAATFVNLGESDLWTPQTKGCVLALPPGPCMEIMTRFAAWLIASVLLAGSLAAQPLPRSVLLIDQYGGSLPWVGARNTAFRTLLNAGRTVPISIYEEYLDFNRFAAPTYKESLKLHFGEKYRDKPIGVIVAFGPSALEYAVDMRTELWPKAPVVFGEITEGAISRSSLSATVTGTTINITLGELVLAARALVPDLKGIALVGDSLDNLPAYRHFKDEIPMVTRDLDFIDLTGLAMADLRSRVRALPGRTVIIYTTINLDRAGVSYVPAEALSLVAEVANRPIVISTETFLGRGAVGGFILTPASVGEDAARLASRVLDGEDASTIAVTTNSVNKPIFDWRQLQRWGINESALPPGSEVRFREPTVWERYRWQITSVVGALLVQTALIVGLFYEHRRRRKAEVVARGSLRELAHINRIATAGELSGSIAHEVKQPLAAMVAHANASLRWLAHKPPDLDEARAALTQIVKSGHNAGNVIESIRGMFKKDNPHGARAPLDINELIRQVVALVQDEHLKHGVSVQIALNRHLPTVIGDRIQLQQVILNLVRNAVEAMNAVTDRERVLGIKTQIHESGSVLVSIEDTGIGIDAKDIDRIFNSLFTTKSEGMGLGLAICRTIIEAHGGRVWALSDLGYGSTFQFILPTVSAQNIS
jgi:signal transduction histidine kinase